MEINPQPMIAEFQQQLGILGARAAEYAAIVDAKDTQIAELQKQLTELKEKQNGPD